MVKGFIEEHTLKKIRILKEGQPQEIKTHFAINQVENKYGGSSPDLTNFWPPYLPSAPYEIEGDSPEKFLTSESTYNLYNQKQELEVSSNLNRISGTNSKISSEVYDIVPIIEPIYFSKDIDCYDEDIPDYSTCLGRNQSNEEWLRIEQIEQIEKEFKEVEHEDSIKMKINKTNEVIEAADEEKVNLQNGEELKTAELPTSSIGMTAPDSTNPSHSPSKASKFCKFCKFCSNKTCAIY